MTIARAQPIGELAVTLCCCTLLADPESETHWNRVAGFLERVRTRRAFSERLMRSQGGFVLLTYIYAALRVRGIDDLQQRAMMQRLLSAGYLEQDERPPFRVMDLRLAADWAELDHGFPSWEHLYEESILARPLRIPFIDVAGAYTFTHAVFFSFFLGTRRGFPVPWIDTSALRRTLSMLLITFCQERDWDMVGELLLCWESADLPCTRAYERAWDAFLDQQEPSGAFSGPEKRHYLGSGRAKDGNGDAEQLYFSQHYHTTLVAIMALSCQASRIRSAAARPPQAAGEIPLPGDRLPIAADLASVVTRAKAWALDLLDGLERDSDRDRHLDALCRILVVLWMCDELLGGDDARHEQTGRIAALLDADDAANGDWGSVPAGLRLLCASLLAAEGRSVRFLTTFARRAHAALAAEAPESAEADLSLAEKRVFFHVIGVLDAPPRINVPGLLAYAGALRLEDQGAFDELVARVNSCAAYGTDAIELPPESGWLVELLTGAALHWLRVYDLARASQAIRTLAYLDAAGAQSARDICTYLLIEQQPAGAFGSFGPESGPLEETIPNFSLELDLQLPVTLDCLWTLGESLGRPWRLYAALSAPHAAG